MAFGQMVFWSNGLSVKWCSAKWHLVNRLFGQKIGEKIFWSSDPEPS
jgi:hypothetical protein